MLSGDSEVTQRGHATIYIIERESIKTYGFVVANTGEGNDYHPFFRGDDSVCMSGRCVEFLRLHRFARSTSAALLHYRFREIRQAQGRAAMDRWRYSDCEGIS